jgi:hypothetical protein
VLDLAGNGLPFLPYPDLLGAFSRVDRSESHNLAPWRSWRI